MENCNQIQVEFISHPVNNQENEGEAKCRIDILASKEWTVTGEYFNSTLCRLTVSRNEKEMIDG